MPTKEFRKSFRETIDLYHRAICEITMSEDSNFYHLLRHFYSFIHDRTQALFFLVQGDHLWDAEILLRPIAECTVKFVYLSCFNNLERDEKVREFWEDLAEINKLKQSKQAQQIVDLTGFQSKFLSAIILEDIELEKLSKKWTKSLRQRTEQPWSYNEMIRTISKRYDEEVFLALSRNFTQSSHFIHADETALGVIFDINTRTSEQKEAWMNLNEVRLLGNCVELHYWLVIICHKLSEKEPNIEIRESKTKFIKKQEKFKFLEEILS